MKKNVVRTLRKCLLMSMAVLMLSGISVTNIEADTTYVSGARLVNLDEGGVDAGDTIALNTDVAWCYEQWSYGDSDVYYYVSPLLAFVPNQKSGVNFFAYTISSSDPSIDIYIVNGEGWIVGSLGDSFSSGSNSSNHGINETKGSSFYILIPVTATQEQVTITVETTEFIRESDEFSTRVSDTATDSVTLTWDAYTDTKVYCNDFDSFPAQSVTNSATQGVVVFDLWAFATAITGHTSSTTEYGELYSLAWTDEQPLNGVIYDILGNEDIYYNDSLFISAGERVFDFYTITLDEYGRGTAGYLVYNGTNWSGSTYRLQTISVPAGYVIPDDEYEVITVAEMTGEGGSFWYKEYNLITFSFEHQKLDDNGDPVADVTYGLYTTEDIITDDGIIFAGSLVGLYTTDENGTISDTPALPATQDYILVELSGPTGYEVDDTEITVKATEATTANGDRVSVIKATTSQGDEEQSDNDSNTQSDSSSNAGSSNNGSTSGGSTSNTGTSNSTQATTDSNESETSEDVGDVVFIPDTSTK